MIKFLKRLFNNKETVNSNRFFIYILGDAYPICSNSFYAISGINVEVFVDEEKVALCQGVSFGFKENEKSGGTLRIVLYDHPQYTKWLNKESRILLKTCNKINSTTLYDAKVKFDSHENFGISIDDIVIEVSLNFTVVERFFEN